MAFRVSYDDLACGAGRHGLEKPQSASGDSLGLFLGELYLGVDQLLRLVALLSVSPSEVFGSRPVLCRFHCYDWLCKAPLAIVWKFITTPLLSPEDHARRIYKAANARGKRKWETRPSVSKEMVRVKWYPDLEAPLKPWPAGLGELWTDISLGPDRSLDLRPLKHMWGMENIYVIDASRGRPLRTGRKPDDQLSELAWNVLLDGHRVLGAIEKATPSTQVAREGRALVKRLATDPTLWLSSIRAFPATVLWTALALLAIPILTVWRIGELASWLIATAGRAAWTTLAIYTSPAARSFSRRLAATRNGSKQLILAFCLKMRGVGYRSVDAVGSAFYAARDVFSNYVSPLLAWLVFAIGICAMVLADGLYQLLAPTSNEPAGDEARFYRDSTTEIEDYLATEGSEDYSYGTNGQLEDPDEWDSERTGDESYGDYEEEYEEDYD
ncbi:hypothetical protein GY45DRAFT_1323708 [Cubamyces sp. BRFM 1775]|nr:hypothetical protein GY45DRAFT_1323708 [Cubamyces sp. BRFM 1775]